MDTVITPDIESIERATVAAVAPERLDEQPGWLLPMDSGTVGRARSAVPLHHAAQPLERLDAIVQAYRAVGFAPALRLPEVPAYATWHQALQAQGWQRCQPTWTQVGTVQALLDLPAAGPAARLDAQPDVAWMAMYLGAGLALFLGDWRIAFVALFLANLIGTILALPKMLSGKLDRGTHVPFGPLLITGSLIAWFVGPLIVSWYQNIVF